MDTRLPYRVGYPILPVFPVENKSADLRRFIPNPQPHNEKVREVLEKNDICDPSVLYLHRFNRGTPIPISEKTLTLLILSHYENEGCHVKWVAAVEQLREHFAEREIHIAIEIIDHRAYNGLKVEPILATDRAIIGAWNDLRSVVSSIIGHHDYLSIDVLHREVPSSQLYRPSVIISARDANDASWWDYTLPSLRQHLTGTGIEVVLLFLNDLSGTMAKDVVKEDLNLDYGNLEAIYGMRDNDIGVSCGLSGSTSSGTMGGIVTLEKDNSRFELGLSNHHVLFEKEMKSATSPTPSLAALRVVCPSDSDHQRMVRHIQEEIEVWTALKERAELRNDDPKKIEHHQNEVTSRSKKLHEYDSYDRSVGSIYASSGFTTCSNHLSKYGVFWALDWCLVNLHPGKGASKTICNVNGAEYIKLLAEFEGYCTIKDDTNYDVFRCGRSGSAAGTISAINTQIRLGDRPPKPEKGPTAGKVELRDNDSYGDRDIFATCIVSKHQLHFLNPGDSGSLVLLDQPSKGSEPSKIRILGLGFAENDSSCVSYMIPMNLVVNSIEGVTGGKVVEPEYLGAV